MLEDYNPGDRYQLTLHLLISLQSPLSHIGETTGNQANLKTLTLSDLEGNSSETFVYSANALRNGILRRCGVDSFLEALGISVNPAVHQTFFSGGYIDGGTGNDLDLDHKIRKLIPPLSLLGTAKPKGVFGGNDAQMVQGRLQVGNGYLVCYESAEYLYRRFQPALPLEAIEGIEAILKEKDTLQRSRVEQWLFSRDERISSTAYNEACRYWLPYLQEKLRSYTEWLTYNQKVRFDSTHDPNLQRHLPFQDRPKLVGDKKEKQKSSQMISGSWLIQEGAQLYSRWDAHLTNLEEGFLADALLKFNESPYLGGMNNVGCGLCSLQFWFESQDDKGNWMTLTPTAQQLSARAEEQHRRYRDYLTEYRAYLDEAKESAELKALLGAG